MTKNKKSADIDFSAMSKEDLLNVIKEATYILDAKAKREEDMDKLSAEYVVKKNKLLREYEDKMRNDYQATDDEIREYLDYAETMVSFSIYTSPAKDNNPDATITEPAEIKTGEDKPTLFEEVLAEVIDEAKSQNVENSSSIFDDPALSASFNSDDAADNTSISTNENKLPSFDEMLSTDSAYNKSDVEQTSTRKKLLPMDELLSGEPINSIQCLGNLKPKGAPFRQHTRINDADGIIPTETAVGRTMILV